MMKKSITIEGHTLESGRDGLYIMSDFNLNNKQDSGRSASHYVRLKRFSESAGIIGFSHTASDKKEIIRAPLEICLDYYLWIHPNNRVNLISHYAIAFQKTLSYPI